MNYRVLASTLAVIAMTIPVGAKADPKSADAAMAQYLVSDSQAEIDLCRLALRKSKNAAVQTFAKKMIADHTAAIAASTALARSQRLGTLDTKPAEDGVIEMNHLARYSGHMFDENFLEHNQEDHTSDIETVRHEAEITKNPAVRAFDDKQLAVLQSHLLLVEQTMDQVAQSE